MRLVAALLSALLLALPCAGSLPAFCVPGQVIAVTPAACCAVQGQRCGAGQADAYCCPTQTAPAPAAASEASLPAPSPTPAMALLDLPVPSPAMYPPLLHTVPPPGVSRPALYLLHRSYRS
ncbi:MAG: hypothetical protein IT369_00885 [Candidatus Latescibacteria bacterium]|nr:hypothetical protein [Candidatus Latescibacterota bacterium]